MADFYQVTGTNVVKGAGRMLVAAIDTPFPDEISDVIDTTTFAATSAWTDVGATSGGITITRGFDTEDYTVDQVNGPLGEDITAWHQTIETSLAETTLDNFNLAWVGGSITTSGNEDSLSFGDPSTVVQRRLAIGFMDKFGKIRLYVFRIVQRTGDDSAQVLQKGGDPMVLPLTFNAYPDTTVNDRNARVFTIFQQT